MAVCLAGVTLLTGQLARAGMRYTVKSAREIRRRTPMVKEVARSFAKVNAKSFLSLPGSKGLSTHVKAKAKSALKDVATKTAEHFGADGYGKLEDKTVNRAALAQHVGYVAGELSRKFGVTAKKARELVMNHYESGEADIGRLAERLAKEGGSGIREFVKDSNNGWMFGAWGFGDADKALNRPGVYAGEATLRFAEALTGSKRRAEKLVDEIVSATPEEAQALLENPHSERGLIAQFGVRAAQTGWITSKLGQGVVEAHSSNEKKQVGAPNRWNAELMTDFDSMAEVKGWAEVAKDLDQIKSFLRHKQQNDKPLAGVLPANVNLVQGDITRQNVDAVITAINSGGMWYGGIDGALQGVAGNHFHNQARAEMPLRDLKTVVAKGSGDRNRGSFKDVVFVVDDLRSPLNDVVVRGLEAAHKAGHRKVALPAIRMGVMRGVVEKTPEDTARKMISGIRQFFQTHGNETQLRDVTVVLYKDTESQRQLEQALALPNVESL